MLASSIPTKFPFPFANSAGSSFIRPVPVASQIGINPGAASDTDGFVPLNFLVPSAGGIPPDGRDVNGILNQMSAWDMWQSVGGPVYYDAAQSTAIGGYPQGALLNAVGFQAGYWWSEVDNNTSDPDTGGANWFFIQLGSSANYVAIVPQTTFFVDNTTGSDTTGNGLTSGTAWQTIQHAVSVLSTFNLNGNTVTIQLGTVGTYPGQLNINSPGNGTLVINGNPAAQSTYTISATPSAGTGVVNVGSGSVSLVGVTVRNSSGGATTTCILCNTSAVSLQDVTVSATSGTLALISASVSGAITLRSGNIIASGASSCLSITSGGSIIQTNNVNVTGTPAFTTAFCTAQLLGIFALPSSGPIWIGSATGPRYLSTLNSVIDTLGGGATYFPGSSAGTATTGLYV